MQSVLKRAFAASCYTRATRRMSGGWVFVLLAIASVPIALRPAYPASYPERPIKIVVPFSPGGPTDVVARLIAQSLSSRLGHNVVVENLAGAGGRIRPSNSWVRRNSSSPAPAVSRSRSLRRA
jgi:hypothetical protein